jgi:hypothetical protein
MCPTLCRAMPSLPVGDTATDCQWVLVDVRLGHKEVAL